MAFDTLDLKRAIEATKAKFPAAIARALKRSGDSGRTAMVKLIADDMAIGQKRVRQDIKVNVIGAAGVAIVAQGKRIPLIEFNARGPEPSRGRGRGVSYKLPGGRGRIDSAFIATMRSGHRGVFERQFDTRLPIEEKFGPSVVKVFEKYQEQGVAAAQASLIKNLEHEVQYALRRDA